MKREPGYYWVKVNGDYEVAQYTAGQCWYRTGFELPFTESSFEKIGNTPLKIELNNEQPKSY